MGKRASGQSSEAEGLQKKDSVECKAERQSRSSETVTATLVVRQRRTGGEAGGERKPIGSKLKKREPKERRHTELRSAALLESREKKAQREYLKTVA